MAKKSMILKQQRAPKFSSRRYNRCKLCGRPHAYLRDYGVCRICFRELAYKGEIPGVRKASFCEAPRATKFCDHGLLIWSLWQIGWRKVMTNWAPRASGLLHSP